MAKHVNSNDSRKAAIMGALKTAGGTDCTRVTKVSDLGDGIFQGDCLAYRPQGIRHDGPAEYEHLGTFTVTAAQCLQYATNSEREAFGQPEQLALAPDDAELAGDPPSGSDDDSALDETNPHYTPVDRTPDDYVLITEDFEGVAKDYEFATAVEALAAAKALYTEGVANPSNVRYVRVWGRKDGVVGYDEPLADYDIETDALAALGEKPARKARTTEPKVTRTPKPATEYRPIEGTAFAYSAVNRADLRAITDRDLPVGTILYAPYKGMTYVARYDGDGKVTTVDATQYESLSAAGRAIRGGSQTNGWAFWKVAA